MIRPTWEKPLYVFRELGTFRSTRRRFAAQRLFDSKNVAQDPRRDNAFIGHNAIGHNVARDSWATSWQQQLACTRKQRYRRSRVFLFYSYKNDSTGYELRRLIVPRDCSITILAGVFTSRLRRNLIVLSIIWSFGAFAFIAFNYCACCRCLALLRKPFGIFGSAILIVPWFCEVLGRGSSCLVVLTARA